MILLVHVKDAVSNATRTLEFAQSPIRIGRNQLNEIPLSDPFISEWHGSIRFDAQGAAYFDMGSTNGTMLDGRRVPKNVPAPLSTESKLLLGRHQLTISPPLASVSTPPPGGKESSFRKTIALGQPMPLPDPSRQHDRMDVSFGRGLNTASRSGAPGAQDSQALGPPPVAVPPATEKIVEAFCEAFIGLRKGFEQFGAEVGVRTISGATPLHRARSMGELRSYLLDPAVDPAVASRELFAIFADFGIHHVAMMEGITESVRGLLQSLDPRAFELGGSGGIFAGSKKSKAKWDSYIEQFEQLVTDDEQLHAAIFGDEFARAYASVTVGDSGPSRPKGRGRDDDEGDG